VNSREVIRELEKDGWFEVNHEGSHKQFKTPDEKGPRHGTPSEKGYSDRNPEEH